MKKLKKSKKFISFILSFAVGAAVMISPLSINCEIQTYAATPDSISISENGLQFITDREGFSPTCFWDYAQWTIGYGTRCTETNHPSNPSNLQKGSHTISKDTAKTRFLSALESTYIPGVRRRLSGVNMTQNQFDALVSLCYNAGEGKLANSPFAKYLRGEITKDQAYSDYRSYVITAGGKVNQGLINRRKLEADLFFSGTDDGGVINPPTKQEGCFSPCGTSFTSIVEALKSIGVDSSMTYRKQIAVANGISGYSGTANQNTQMLSMLKAGTLKIPNDENPVVPEEPPVIDYGTGVFPTCSSSFSSIVDALKSIGVDSSMSNRKTIAAANGISSYSGTADQNNQMLNLLKSGQLKNPNATATTPDTSGKYFSACSSGATSIVDALKSIGIDSSMSNRKTIAAANGISGYSGTADQNNKMLNLLKSGQLVNPLYVAPSTVVNYNVTLNANGGYTPIDNLPVASDSTYAGLPVASREGYTFNGWFTSADGGSQVLDGNGLVSASDHTLYAHWSANKYTVSFENNDGSGITSSKDVVYDNNYGELPVPTRTGYTFTGWFTDIADGVQVTSDTKYNYADNQTVYAHWQANQYQVTLNYYETNDTYKYFPACPANITNFVDGLKTVGADSSFANRKAIAALNDIADYVGTTSQNDQMLSLLKKGELRSDYSNIVGLPAPFDTITVTYYNFYGEMPIPEYGSKIFKGWFTEDGTEITKESTVLTAKDHALYAHWDDAFELSSDSVVLKSGEQYEIKSNQKNLTYKSNNTDVAVVSKNGVITALDEGTATISVINADSDVLQVNVKVISESIKGDANNDGEINIADAVMLQKWLLGSGNLIDWHNANLCEDEKIDVFDMIEMRKLLIKNK